MTWFKVDDTFAAHPKVAELEAGPCFPQAVALWTLAGSWCASQLTDGRVPATQLRRLVPFDGRRAAAELVRVGLWSQTDDGYAFRDWHHYQPTRDEVETTRESSVRRARKYREKQRERASLTRDDDVTSREHHASVTRDEPVTSRPRDAAPSRPVPSRSTSPDGAVVRASAPTAAAHLPAHVESFERSLVAPTSADRAVAELVSETRQAAGGAPFRATAWQDREALQKLAEWSAAVGGGPERLRAVLSAFWAAKGTGGRLSWLVEEDPGRFLGSKAPRTRAGGIAAPASHEEHAAAVAQAVAEGRPHGEGWADVGI
jgi:hypothetical protein